MKTKIILRTIISLIVLFPVCSSLRGDSNSLCSRNVSHHQTYSKSYYVSRKKGFWAACTIPVWEMHYRTQWNVVWTTEEICCDGYKNENGTCEPTCSHPCVFGNCTAPNTCTCNPGFRTNSTTKNCDPVCTKPCVNGFCESPETCRCFEGYDKISANSTTCVAICQNCTNGICVEPNKCVFANQFEKEEAKNGTNVPTCEPPCVHGTCSAERCECSLGWDGTTCATSLLCIVTQSINNATSELTKLINGTENATEDSEFTKDRPTCLPKCLDQLNTTVVNATLQSSLHETHYLVPINSQCNTLLPPGPV